MRLLDLFSGIGGFSLAAQWVWGDELEIVAFCEIDKFCQKVLHKHWPDVPIIEDVRDVKGDEFGPVDLLCGGPPCQPASCAGKRKGTEDDRWLWDETLRVTETVKPRWCLFENPTGILSLQGGVPFEHLLLTLEAQGFSVQTIILPACAVNAPHRRDRVWIVAYDGCFSNESDRIGTICDEKKKKMQGKVGQQRVWSEIGNSSQDVADSSKSGLSKPALSKLRSISSQAKSSKGSKSCGGMPATGGNWSTEPDVGRGFDGFPSWLYRHCGRGLSYAESTRRTKVLRSLWNRNVSEALWKNIGGFGRMEQAEILFAFVCQYEKNPDQIRLLLQSQEIPKEIMRNLWNQGKTSTSSFGSTDREQFSGEHSDSMQELSRFLAYNGESHWEISSWEDAIPRVAKGVKERVNRLKSLGNAIVPQVAEVIFRAIKEVEEHKED